MKHVCLEEAYV